MPDSVTSTTCSSPTNVSKTLENESIRYKKKGYGLITASLITLTFFFVIPAVAKPLWEQFTAAFPGLGKTFLFLAMSLVHTFFFTIGNLGMMVVYKLKWPFFERYKITTKQWPWEANPEKWRQTMKRTIKGLALIHFVYGPILFAIDIFVLEGIHLRLDAETFPTSGELMKHLLFFMICEDFMFYWTHRLLHHPKLYPYIHKIHHEYVDPVSISSEYAHPIESIFGNMIPMALGSKILGYRVHWFTFAMWTVVRIFETIDGHSGYEFSWSPYRLLPFSGSAKYHDFHHTHNDGNYCSFFTIWDTVMKTNRVYLRYQAKKENERQLARQREMSAKEGKKDETLTTTSASTVPLKSE